MPFEERVSKSNLSTKNADSNSPFIIRSEQDARNVFSQFLSDEQAAKTAAATFIKLGKELSRNSRNSSNDETSAEVYQRFYKQVVRDSRTNKERTAEEKVIALNNTLMAMREENLAARSSPEARRAHLEIDSYNEKSDNLRELFETPYERTRAEHATYLNSINKEARDLYERGATVYGNTLIIPREANSLPESKDKVRIGSLSNTVKEFTPLVGEEKAREKAAEFIELGRNISGRTADGDTLIVVFREFYDQIKRDDSGRVLSSAEKAERLDIVLERMRELSDAMYKEEWKREPVEFFSLDDWERGLESLGRDSENEYNGRLTYRLEETLELYIDDEIECERINERTEELTLTNGNLSNISYERIRLDDAPPRLPQNLSQEDQERLRYETIPLIDRAIENGIRPRDIIKGLSTKANNETQKELNKKISRIFLERAPSATDQEQAVTREEEARALYTLYALGVVSNEAIKERGFTEKERAAAIDIVGTRIAQDYRDQLAKLKTFAELEQKRDELSRQAFEYSESVRASPEFQSLLETARIQENQGRIAEKEALNKNTTGNFVRNNLSRNFNLSTYSDLVGESRPPSTYTQIKEENERARKEIRAELKNLLVNPDIEKSQTENANRITEAVQYFSRVTSKEITNSNEAKLALNPSLRQMRSAIDNLDKERTSINIPRTRNTERQSNPLYVGLSSNPNLRLPIENNNEYRTVTVFADKLQVNIQPYANLYGKAITGDSPSRIEELNFAREYISYRLKDDTTRLQNSNRLFREFSTRLNNARNIDSLRKTINEIRQENYSLEKQPQSYFAKFAKANDEQSREKSQSFKPLTEFEMKKLLLSEVPTHYSTEMRDLRLNYSLNAREKAERIESLEKGTLAPSAGLKTLLSEFDRTQTSNSVQTTRNINSFLADYLNPPTSNGMRFSRHNLYELRQQLSPAERDYFFKVVGEAKQTAISNTPKKQLEQQEQQERKVRVQETKTKNVQQPKTLPDVIEERVSNYLVSVIKTRGIQALESSHEGLEHAANISRIIKETFKQNGREFGEFKITDERIAVVAGKLVGELPSAIREYGKQISIKQNIESTEKLLSFTNIGRDIKDSREVSNREETVRIATQSAIEPLVNQKINENQKERVSESVLNLNQEQALSQSASSQAMLNQPRPQDIASRNQTQKENRYILSK